ncbi:enoyl-CoA hydratase/isomerase family protein [Noviherbaspirillum saxi]|uniref:Enoyl-CoA hydratase/isomerase family protein n=1 Tax=Noviherbaspirillum saxi TaxID=2320863 RepID=A0A3A3FIN8_9BURK|nr:enoyl-CoA hydratase/isomerase family protein [Noviherbaspirillum saxi]RJF92404.1 enoyl-CoA hydratase/isomerase family protein [Noviherbaspirillum saxi]
MFETIDIEIKDCIATLWMNRPAIHNAFNPTLILELTDALHRVAMDANVRIVVLAGRGKNFSAGADLEWMQAVGKKPMDENIQDARQLAEMLRTLAELPKPTVARVSGAALGGGMGLASACDICVASDDAIFATSEVRLGLIPSAISPYVIRAIGERQAYRYFQTGERVTAPKAAALGLVHEVVPTAQLDTAVALIVEALLKGGPAAQTAAKSLIQAVGKTVMSWLVEDTVLRIANLRTTPEAQEGIAAFLSKRPPNWAGE